MNLKISSFLKIYRHLIISMLLFLSGALLSLLGLIQRVPLLVGILGIALLSAGMLYYCIRYFSEKTYKDYYKECYEIEHETIADEIRKSMQYHRYQEAVINRYESACRDLGLSNEQKDWLISLLMDEKNKVDEDLKATGGGHI